MEDKKTQIINLIMKLLELGSEKNPNENERNSASAKAAQLMADYAIDCMELRKKVLTDNTIEEHIRGLSARYNGWESDLASYISNCFDSKIILRRTSEEWIMIFIGNKGDVEIATFFFKYLRRSVGRSSETYHKNKKEQNTFAYGMTVKIGHRLKELYKQREEFIPSDCKALVVVKKDNVANYIKKNFPRLGSTTAAKVSGSREAYLQGQIAGEKINLSRPIGNNPGNAGYIS